MASESRSTAGHSSSTRSAQSRTRARIAGACALLALGVACKLDPRKPEIHYKLSEETTKLDERGEPVVPLKEQDHIRGSLEMLFGTAEHPQFMRLSEWLDAGFDPNYPQFPADDSGGGEFSEQQLADVLSQNQRTFRRQLEKIEARLYDEVPEPITAPDLAADWKALLEGKPAAERDDAFQKEARDLFVGWYPTLRDSAELYRQQCLHCHGSEGGGNGPTADFLNPRPRDYRRGIFKFTGLKDKAAPRRADLYRILEQGVTGTAMPSFRRFAASELNGLVDYVRLLSMRGMVERDLAITFEQDGSLPVEYVTESYKTVWERWKAAGEKLIAFDGVVPQPTPESIARGKELFHDASRGNCASCHGDTGHGDGVSAFTLDPATQKKVSAYQDEWGHDIVPRDLTTGLFRGGRRPLDIYRRIYAGINGTPMPALGEAKDAAGNPLLTSEDLWAIVHYVGSLSEKSPAPHHP